MAENIRLTTPAKGLSSSEVKALREEFGYNLFSIKKQYRFLHTLITIVREPMFILLFAACLLYFLLGSYAEGMMMTAAMTLIAAISIYQGARSSRAIESLQELTKPLVIVIRDGVQQKTDAKELVPGDIILLQEGANVPADALVLSSNDLSINESIITGESVPVSKNEEAPDNKLYQGTLVDAGKCTAIVTATGSRTELGKLGKSIESFGESKTPLEIQVNRIVRRIALFGISAFILIFIINYSRSGSFAVSMLFALTLAMSAIPEEIPVAFSSFFALGAYRLGKLGIIASRPQIIENLGAVNTVCLDKTGTITENKMTLRLIYDFRKDEIYEIEEQLHSKFQRLMLYAALASEAEPFDAMEKAILAAFHKLPDTSAYKQWQMIHEYSLQGQPPMMTHIYRRGEETIAAAKGAAERIISVCRLSEQEHRKIYEQAKDLATKGYRILGVASAIADAEALPPGQDEFNWQLEGLLALYDPPRISMPDFISGLYAAKVHVKMLTGDSAATAVNIAGQIGIKHAQQVMNGAEVMETSIPELQKVVTGTTVFARMFPEAKLKVIQAMQLNGDVVAMTGDGVNDGPALKVADIGIAMGKKGSETARRASDLILTNDDLSSLLTAISNGRTIYNNLIKAVRYILSIHIPIILTAAIPVILGWKYPNIFTPIHVIFLELIMGPTCSIFFEREPPEENIMQAGPRARDRGLFTPDQILLSVMQGLVIAAGILSLYFIFMKNGHSIEQTRMAVFSTLVMANVFLTFVSRSSSKSVLQMFSYKNNLAIFVLLASAVFLAVLHLFNPARQIFGLAPLTNIQFLGCVATAFVSVMWVEMFKKDLPASV